ncbi:MAG: c-type cytochrome, partial [Limnochordales bacterium]
PTFGAVNGGPLNELYRRAVATFIMMGDWSQVSAHIPPPEIPDDREVLLSRLPDAAGLTPEENRRAKEIFHDRGCMACHSMNGIGGNVGPDLTVVGAWTQLLPVEEWEAFLYRWVENPPAMENRAPVYWSNYSGPLPYAAAGAAQRRTAAAQAAPVGTAGAGGPDDDRWGSVWEQLALPNPVPLPPTQMPPMPMTDEERAALVRWLARLGR